MLLAVAIAAGPIALTTADRARAQTVFTTVQAFGDSYADNGNIFRLVGVPFPVEYPTGRFSGGTNFNGTTADLPGVPQFNYALGGAQTGATNVGPGFVASGRRFSSSDLIEISIGGNDARAHFQAGGTLAGVPAAAATSAVQATAAINALIVAGVRNIVFTAGDVSALPEANGGLKISL